MTQIPSGQMRVPPDAEFSDFRSAPARPRVSVLALASMLLGGIGTLLCCLPLVAPISGIIALGLGSLSLLLIRRSEGRLRGTVPAGIGIGLGILAMVLGSVMLLLLAQAAASAGQYQKVVEIAQREDQSELVNVLTTESANAITKEELSAFRTTTLDELGEIRGVDGGVAAWLKAYGKVATIDPSLQSKYVVIPTKSLLPVPVRFEKASASLVVAFDSGAVDPQLPMGRVVNVAVVKADGTMIWLIDPARDLTLPVPAAPEALGSTPPVTPEATPTPATGTP